jgi:hypothetical protein
MSSSSTENSPEKSSGSSSGSNEPGGGSDRQVVARHVPSNPSDGSEMKRCHVTGYLNFVEAHPFVGRFKPDAQPSPASLLHLSPPRLKVADTVAPSLAPACNYGVFNPAAPRVSQR